MTTTALRIITAGAMLASVAATAPVLSRQAGPGSPAAARAGTGFVPGRLARVERFIQGKVDDRQLPGAVLLLARHGRVATLRAFGAADLATGRPMAPDSLFRMASAAKIVTAVGLLTLYEEGRFALGDAVGDHLPAFRQLRVRQDDGSVRPATRRLTIRDLLRHTTGFGYGGDARQRAAYHEAGLMPVGRDDDWSHAFTLDQWTARLATVPLTSEPGTRFEYGLGSDIAGALIERVSGQRLDAFLASRVFAPLGMRDTGFIVTPERQARMTTLYEAGPRRFDVVDAADGSRFVTPPSAWSGGGGWDMAGHGGLVTTATDFFRFLQMLLNRGALEGTRVLSRHTVELMFTNQLATLAVPERAPGVGFGFGYAIVTDAARYGEVGSPGLMWWAGSANTRYWLDPRSDAIGLYLTQVLPFPYQDLMGSVMRLSLQALE